MKVNLPKSIFVEEKPSHGKDVVGNFDKHNTVAFIRFPDDIFQSSLFKYFNTFGVSFKLFVIEAK